MLANECRAEWWASSTVNNKKVADSFEIDATTNLANSRLRPAKIISIEVNMYGAVAKGHATQFINKQKDHSCVEEWVKSEKSSKAQTMFQEISQSEKEDWVLQRLSPLVCPPFAQLVAARWQNDGKIAFAPIITAARETEIFENANEEMMLFTEPSIFLTDLFFHSRSGNSDLTILTAANFSHHALSRMLERELVSLDDLHKDTMEILMIARSIRQFFEITQLNQNMTWNLLIPFADGAFVARTLRANAGIQDYYQGRHPILSIRTYLENHMLSDLDRERMTGFKIFKEAYVSTKDAEHMKGWIRGNARAHLQPL